VVAGAVFEELRDIPRAIAGPREVDQDGAARAVQWFLRQLGQVGGQPLLYVPGRHDEDNDPQLQALARRSTVTTQTWKTLANSGWGGGPVLAAWPNDKHLTRIDGDRRTRALCVLVWTERETAAWASAHQPEQLSPGASTPAPAMLTDPVVEQGLRDITQSVNQSNNLAGPMDRRDAVTALQLMHDSGYHLDADAIYAWALAHGWRATGAQRLRDYATAIDQGKRPRAGMPSALGMGTLERWRALAAKKAATASDPSR
jgi:hypothetical protein